MQMQYKTYFFVIYSSCLFQFLGYFIAFSFIEVILFRQIAYASEVFTRYRSDFYGMVSTQFISTTGGHQLLSWFRSRGTLFCASSSTQPKGPFSEGGGMLDVEFN